MSLQKFVFQPGINKEVTDYANKGGYYNCDKVRFRFGFPEKIGGWVNYSSGNTFYGVPRSLNVWTTSASETLLSFGTNQKYYVEYNGVYNDITPVNTSTTLTSIGPFSTTAGSQLVNISATANGISVGTFMTFTGSTVVGGSGVTISGSYEVVAAPDPNTLSISVSTPAATTVANQGGTLPVTFNINAGSAGNSATTSGWGIGPYGNGGWGQAVASSPVFNAQAVVCSQSNNGDDLMFAYRGGKIYYWVKNTAAFTPAVPLATYATTQTKTTKTATFSAGVSTITISDALLVNAGALITGTGIPAGTYVGTSYQNGTSVPLTTLLGSPVLTTAGNDTNGYSFSYSTTAVPAQTYQVLTSDINQFTVAIGSTPYGGTTFAPMLVRWSDQTTPSEWVPETTNQSGQQPLSRGSYLVCGRSTRQEILIWSNSALYSMQYVGAPQVFGFFLLMDNISIVSPNAAITVNNVTYWMGRDKFYMYSGQVQTLPSTLRTFVFRNLNQNQAFQVVCGHNPSFNEIWWMYPSSGSNFNDSYVIFNYQENVWSYGTMTRSAWLSNSIKQSPIAAFAVQNSYLSAAIGATDTSISLINALTYPNAGTVTIDSETVSYTGNTGYTLTGCIRGVSSVAATHAQYAPVNYYVPNQLLYHESGTDDLSVPNNTMPISAYVESSDVDIGDGHTFSFVSRILPDVTFNGSTSATPSVTLTVKPRMDSGSAYTPNVDSPVVVESVSYPVEVYTGSVYTRVRGRQVAFRIESNTIGTAWQMGAMRFDIRPDGRRG